MTNDLNNQVKTYDAARKRIVRSMFLRKQSAGSPLGTFLYKLKRVSHIVQFVQPTMHNRDIQKLRQPVFVENLKFLKSLLQQIFVSRQPTLSHDTVVSNQPVSGFRCDHL